MDKKRKETKHRTEWLECGQRKMLEGRGDLPKEDGDQPREYKAVHEENFLSSWPREDVEDTVEGRKNMNKEAREEESKSGKREVERKEVKTVVKRKWVNPLSRYSFENFVPGRRWKVLGFLCSGSCGSSVCVPVRPLGVHGVTDVPVSSLLVGDPLRVLIVNLLKRSPFLSPESAKRSLLKIKEE